MSSNNEKQIHLEFIPLAGESRGKWVRGVVSHTIDEIVSAWQAGEETIVLRDADGGVTAVDLANTYLIRAQTDAVFQERSEYVRKKH